MTVLQRLKDATAEEAWEILQRAGYHNQFERGWEVSVDGLIVDGSVRDTAEIEEIKGFEVFCRGTDPSALRNVMLMGINVPIRIGQATVMPGDIAISDPEGITFIPPQLVEQVAGHAELDHLVDDWGEMMLREQKYTPGQIDGRWTNPMIEEFNQWAASKGSKLRLKEH